ncbi:MAG: aldo/keto reductase [Planctomycetota bacterium]
MSHTFQLSGGDSIPAIGLGLWKIPRDQTATAVQSAIEIGYRHLDAACDYGNEPEAGVGIHSCLSGPSVKRDDLWITSKLWNTYHRPEHVRMACERTLKDLQLDYLDLYHIHFPISLAFVPFETRYPPEWFHDPDADHPRMVESPVPIIETWQAMTELVAAGLVRHVGVCNFGVSLLRDLMAATDHRPKVLQIELHPYLTQTNLLRFCREHEIHVTGFSPLGAESYYSIGMAEKGDGVLGRTEVQAIAQTHDKTAAQVVLRWGIQRGTSIVPKTSRLDRMRENIDVFDFELSDNEMAALSAMDQHRRFNDPADFGERAFNTFMPIYE